MLSQPLISNQSSRAAMALHRKARGVVHARPLWSWLLLWSTLVLVYVLVAKTTDITRLGCSQDHNSSSSSSISSSYGDLPGGTAGQHDPHQKAVHQQTQLPRSLAVSGSHQGSAQLHMSVSNHLQQQQQHGPDSATAAVAADSSSGMCIDGRLTGSRKVFWRHLDGASPALMDLLHTEDRVYAVFNLKQQQNCEGWCGQSNHVKLPWAAEGKWTMVFPEVSDLGLSETVIPAQPLATDGHGHTLTVYSTIPRQYAAVSTEVPLNVTIRAAVTFEGKPQVKVYDDVPLCMQPARVLPYHLTACTGMVPEAAASVPEWVAYHSLQGFEHFVVYVDGPADSVRTELQPLITAGLLTVVDFNWPASAKRNCYSQQAIQNSCIMHARGESRWLALHDVDEYLHVPAPGKQTVADFLGQHSNQEHLAAFAVCMYFFGSSSNSTFQDAQTAAEKGLSIGKFVNRAEQHVCDQREKLIVNPHSTAYVSVHVVTSGGDVKRPDATKELRLVHYKSPEKSQYPVVDTSMAEMAAAVRNKLDSIYPGRQW